MRDRFSWSRFLPFAVMSVIWGIFMHANPRSRWSSPRSSGSTARSGTTTGSEPRAGWDGVDDLVDRRPAGHPRLDLPHDQQGHHRVEQHAAARFGSGWDINPDDFALEAAEFLESHNEIKGNILNTSMPQGDVLIWKAAPQRKTYIDGRTRLFPRELLEQWQKTRKALSEDDVETWKPLLDKYEISAIMIETEGDLR